MRIALWFVAAVEAFTSLLEFLTTKVFHLDTYGESLRTRAVKIWQWVESAVIPISAIWMFWSITFLVYCAARASIGSPVVAVLMAVVAGVMVATLNTVFEITILVSEVLWKNIGNILGRFVMIALLSFLTPVGFELFIFQRDIQVEIDRSLQAAAVTQREQAKLEAETRSSIAITLLERQLKESGAAEQVLCNDEKIAKQREIDAMAEEMRLERAQGGRGRGSGAGTTWGRLDAAAERLRTQLTVITARCQGLATANAEAIRTATNARQERLEAEKRDISSMRPGELARRYGFTFEDSRGLLRQLEAFEEIKKRRPQARSVAHGTRLFGMLIDVFGFFIKLCAVAAVAAYYSQRRQAKHGHPEAVALMKAEGWENPALACLTDKQRLVYDSLNDDLTKFGAAINAFIVHRTQLAATIDAQGVSLALEVIRAQLRTYWEQNVEPLRSITGKQLEEAETIAPPTGWLEMLLGGENPWAPTCRPWDVIEARLTPYGWKNPTARLAEIKVLKTELNTRRQTFEFILARYHAALVKMVSQDKSPGDILLARVQAWNNTILPLVQEMLRLEGELGPATPLWTDNPLWGLEARFCTPWGEVADICKAMKKDFTPPTPIIPTPSQLLASVAASAPSPRPATSSALVPPIPSGAQRPAPTGFVPLDAAAAAARARLAAAQPPPPTGGFDLDDVDDDADTGQHMVPPPPRQPPPLPRNAKTLQGQGPQPPIN